MKVYLAGKIRSPEGDWRDELLGGRRTVWDDKYRRHRSIAKWDVEVPEDVVWGDEWDPTGGIVPWRTLPGIVLGTHDYVGPYRQSITGEHVDTSNVGDWHGIEARGEHGFMHEDNQERVYNRCRDAINRADLVFAVINSPDAYGTIVEIAWASLMGKFTSILVHPQTPFAHDDLWFVERCGNHTPEWMCRESGENYEPVAEPEAVVEAFRSTLIAYLRWLEDHPPVPMMPAVIQQPTIIHPNNGVLRETARSLSDIARWTSDPRVRDEAHRMMRRLSATVVE